MPNTLAENSNYLIIFDENAGKPTGRKHQSFVVKSQQGNNSHNNYICYWIMFKIYNLQNQVFNDNRDGKKIHSTITVSTPEMQVLTLCNFQQTIRWEITMRWMGEVVHYGEGLGRAGGPAVRGPGAAMPPAARSQWPVLRQNSGSVFTCPDSCRNSSPSFP